MGWTKRFAAAVLTAIATSSALADRATGDVAAAACASCHGVNGEGDADIGIPALGGLPREYFVKQIADFRTGKRASPIKMPADAALNNSQVLRTDDPEAAADFYARWMIGVAKGLSTEDAKAAAGYYAQRGLPRAPTAPAAAAKAEDKAKPKPAPDPEVIALGKDLAINGDWDRNIPPCFKCHALGGVGVAPAFPPLAGQHPDYVVRQLKAWKSGARTNDPLDLMKRLSKNLTEAEMRAVALYMASLGPQEKAND